MPSIPQNLAHWNDLYPWPNAGDEWSVPWGGADAQWRHSILPRIAPFLDVETILEIAPGHGRWTQFLRHRCRRLIIVDLSPRCIDVCRQRFGETANIEYCVNDGLSLRVAADHSVDFIFSFDSLVHAEPDVMAAYLAEAKRILRPSGVCVMHHSNLGDYGSREGEPFAADEWNMWRSGRVSAESIRQISRQVGLWCTKQELINWGNIGFLLDCLSTLRHRPPSHHRADCEIVRNMSFMPGAADGR